MPIIRDPVHNKKQGKYGVVWCPDEKNPNTEGVLAVYDKDDKKNQLLRNLPTGWEIFGTLKDVNQPYKWCNVLITKELFDITIGNATGAASQLLGNTLRDNPMLMIQELKNAEVDLRDNSKRIYPIDLEF